MASDDDKWAKLREAHAEVEIREIEAFASRAPAKAEQLTVTWNFYIVHDGNWQTWAMALLRSLPVLTDNLESGEP